MGIVLQDCRCYRPAGEMVVEEHRRRSHEQTPPLPLLERCALTFPTAQGQVEVEALLDTGTDITIFKKEKFREIEKRLPRSTRIPIRRISFSGTLTPAYPLTFVLPGGTSYIFSTVLLGQMIGRLTWGTCGWDKTF